MKLAFRFLMASAMILVLCHGSFAQISAGGTPRSFQMAITSTVPTAPLQTVDVAAYLAEDEAAGKDVAYRFGAPLDVSFNLNNSGVWTELPDGGRVWRLHVQSPGAYSIGFTYDQWYIPEGADLFIYNDDRSFVIGAFTSFNNWVDGTNITQPVPGDGVTLEYYEPATVRGQGVLSISRVVHAYRNLFGYGNLDNYGDSGSCNNNVNCPEGATWQTQKRGVAMILDGGYRICSGSLVNNVRQDQTPYFLTANHCLGGETSWVFMFNYESPTCTNANGPTTQTVANATLRATNTASDFALLQLGSNVPSSYNPFFNGWNRVNTAATSSVGIHHPSGDIKKISFDNNAAVSDRYLGTSGVANSHWKIVQWDDGTTEGGSSGSPLFDQNHRITGQLHGGYASCTSLTSDWYGKFSMSWDYGSTAATRLKDWLDPDNAAPNTLDGLDGSVASITVTAPNGGETILVDDSYNITWTSQNISENVKIEINRSYSGGTWETIVASTANDGSYAWTVTSPTTTAARVRISGVTQTTVTDISNANFTIAARSITVTAPNGGETWYAGDIGTITWTSQYLTENVKIELNRSYSGGAWETIISSTADDGSHSWTVSTPVTSAARIRVSGVTHTTVSDVSNANFTIAERTITVTSPNGGEAWVDGTTHNITWTSQNVTGNVNVELNRSYPGGTWEVLAGGISNTGLYPWLVNLPVSSTARVRVSSVSYVVATDESDANFTILPANQTPVLLHDQLDDQETGPFTITALVYDDFGGFVTRFVYKLTTAPTYDSLALSATGYPNEYAATISSLTAGKYDYFLRTIDVGGLTAATDVYTFEVGEACGTEQVYDDGVAEVSNWSYAVDYRWAVKFDAGTMPYMLCEGRIGISAIKPDSTHSPITVELYLADGINNMPGTLVMTKTIGSVGNVIGGLMADPAAWATVLFRDAAGDPLILEDDFYVAVSNPEIGKYEAFLHDTSSVRAGRSVVYDPCEEMWIDELAVHTSARPGNRLI
ncbi:MAG: trypsin-like serine peptidase, partial [Calditrichota bacterium]